MGHKIQTDRLASDRRRVTPLACIHRSVKPLDGRMVVANPYLAAGESGSDREWTRVSTLQHCCVFERNIKSEWVRWNKLPQ